MNINYLRTIINLLSHTVNDVVFRHACLKHCIRFMTLVHKHLSVCSFYIFLVFIEFISFARIWENQQRLIKLPGYEPFTNDVPTVGAIGIYL